MIFAEYFIDKILKEYNFIVFLIIKKALFLIIIIVFCIFYYAFKSF
ncbi:hypothetical protein HMPREF9400_0992 [Campylobacter upsaliensis JV21]|uniref:Uncharacterized protein n=1 Tax=Campylobacter upsaliensis JV21 TaxID=888826 RepID=A0A828QX67_CAMUP|nr:hypothetical protein HMPREF9400_0992 [Campylobacter upsaliensis JV21]